MESVRKALRLPGARLVTHLLFVVVVFLVLTSISDHVDPLTNYYIALAGMYAAAMFGMVILVGLSGQVSLGNGALMAIGAYSFALVSLNWQTVPIIGVPMNGWWAMVFAGIGGIVFGLIIGGLGARLKGPYLAGLTLGIAVGVPAIANRFPDLLGGENGLMLTVPYPEGGYAPVDTGATDEQFVTDLPTSQDVLPSDGSSGAGDLLTSDNFPSTDAGSVAPGDLLTADNFPSTDPSSDGDLLTSDNFPSDGASTDSLPSIDTSGTDTSGSTGSDGLDGGFVIEHWQAGLSILVACIVLFMALNLVRGRQGNVWRAVRDDPVAAAVSGMSPAWSKITAFAVSSFFAALSGGVFAQILSYVGPGAFALGLSLSLLVGVVLGGRSALLGAVIGAVLLVWLPEFIHSAAGDRGWEEQVTNNAPNLIYGLLVVLVVLVAPGGIVGSLQGLVAKVTKRVRPNR
ncbi:MAG: branched-chain amino acid ABC transporter permease [bacterium]|nr:branched-chain amino acid ABC transporter permease [bacterium]